MVACSSSSSGSSSGSASVAGTISGASFSAQDALFASQTLANSGTPPVTEVAVAVTNFGGACGASPSGSDAVLSIIVLGSDLKTYSVAQDGADVSYTAQYDGSCHMHSWATASGGGSTTDHAVVYHQATSGSVTLTSVSSTHAEGTFDVTFDSGDHLTGHFSAGTCMASGGGGSSC
jgi:hypothetical protein